jgi:peptidoglycan/xylan/chitin deacetylase (PgdA/CDA1 family)
MTITYPRTWSWPKGEKLALSVGLAFEDFENASQYKTDVGFGKKNHFSLSFGDYGWKVGAWRLMETLGQYDIKANVSTNGRAAERHPDVCLAMVKAGYELNGHGWVNDILAGDDNPEQELAEIKRCTEAITKASGGLSPVGWTSPGATGSKNTLSMLKAEGYLWNGDDASDDVPFLRDTSHGPIVIMPRTNTLHNDLSMWLAPKNPPSIIWDGFKATFDQLYAEGKAGRPSWTEITLHCHIAGRATLQAVIRQCLDYARQHDGIWYARRCDIARWTLEREANK